MVRSCLLAIALIAVAICGCGSGGPAVYPVTGKVTVGGQPMENVNVTFHPSDSTLPVGTGRTKADGSYEISSGAQGQTGVAAGKYKVTLQQIVGGGKDAAMEAYQKGKKSATPKAETKISEDYSSAKTTKKEVEVKAENNVINIDA